MATEEHASYYPEITALHYGNKILTYLLLFNNNIRHLLATNT